MITGLEPILGPALGKCAGAGAVKLSAWGGGAVLQGRRRRKIRALTHSKQRAAQLAAVEALPASDMAALIAFCSSADLENVAVSMTRAYLLEGTGKKADKFHASIRQEFASSLKLWLSSDPGELVTEAIFAAVNEAVLQNVQGLLDRPKLADAVEAELIATAASVAAASVRNTDLLRSLQDLDDIRAFETQYKSQASALHATMRLPHAGTTRQVPYEDLFVQPYVWWDAVTRGSDRGRIQTRIDFLLERVTRLVILGDPGGGKSTLSRKLVFDLAADRLPSLRGKVPFFVELRDYAPSVRGRDRQTLLEYLESLCRSPYNLEAPESALEYLLLNNRAVVVLDGLDELLDVSLRRDVVQAVEGFAHRYPTCPMVVTSRRVGYSEAALSGEIFSTVALSEFSEHQVADYVNKWFKLDESVPEVRQGQLAGSFIEDSQFVSDLRVNPLMLSLMCGIYASENYIPRNRPDVYEKCALLLFERWDKQRGIVPELSFDAHVQAALRSLALYMLNSEYEQAAAIGDGEGGVEGLSREHLVRFLKQYLREKRFDNDEDAERAAGEFVDFCKGRAWVLTDVGAETYGFTHRTFLEYFAASQLVRLHTNAEALYGELREKIQIGASDVVAQLAVQILGRTTEDGADDFLRILISDVAGSSHKDLNSVSFAARALNFIVPQPEILKEICSQAVRLQCDPKRRPAPPLKSHPIADAMECSLENAPRVAAAIRDSLDSAFAAKSVGERIFRLALLPPSLTRMGDFWQKWADENFDLYARQVATGSRRFFWIALMRYEKGEISCDDLLASHGVAALYDFRIAGATDIAPFVYRFLVRADRGGYPGLQGRVKPARASSIVDDLLRLLPEQKTPWLTYKKDYESTSLILERSGPRQPPLKWPNLRLLLALPLLEDKLEADGAGYDPLLQEAMSERRALADKVPRSAGSQLLRPLEGFPGAQTLMTSWLEGKVTLLDASRRSTRPSARSRVLADAHRGASS